MVTLTIPGSAHASPDGVDKLALLNPGIYDRPFALEILRGDAIGRGSDKLQIIDAEAGEDSANGNGNDKSPQAGSANEAANRSDAIYEVSATVDPLAVDTTDHGGSSEADASKHVEHGTAPASAGDDSSRGQSQPDSPASEIGSAAASSMPGMTRRETPPIMGNRSAICTLLAKAPQPPQQHAKLTRRETIPIVGNRSAICTLLKKAPQPPSSMPS